MNMEKKELHISISRSNSKMGNVSSISLPPVKTCAKGCPCSKEGCYALKLCKLRKTVREAYNRNLDILTNNPEQFYRELEGTIKSVTYFRLHVSGDFVNEVYLNRVIEIVKRNPHCQVLAFTKRYDMVNEWISKNGELPSNFHLLFSAWRNYEMKNPNNLPEAHVLFRNGETTAKSGAMFCSGNCFECFTETSGCISLKKGEQVIFRQH